MKNFIQLFYRDCLLKFALMGLNPVLRFTENRKELAHVKALPLRVAGNPLMGYANTGGRCALPLFGGHLLISDNQSVKPCNQGVQCSADSKRRRCQ